MTCDEARDLLLEADLEVLRGHGDTPLAEHLSGCAACSRLARRLLADQGAMDRVLADLSKSRRHRPGRPRVLPWGLAAAAVLALAVVSSYRRMPASSQAAARVEALASGGPDVDVSAAAGRDAVVFRTADPQITVVWFY